MKLSNIALLLALMLAVGVILKGTAGQGGDDGGDNHGGDNGGDDGGDHGGDDDGHAGGGLMRNFYWKTCPTAEQTIRNVVWNHIANDPLGLALPARLLRTSFHDCFIRGCDGSVLINSTASFTAEKDDPINANLAGFDVIEEAKTAVETICPGIVSCADILQLAARDAVSFQFKRALWDVVTGRRDGTVSLASEVPLNMPAPTLDFASLEASFARKGLNRQDLVTLSGAHTIGVGHCQDFGPRVFNFSGKGDSDPSLNATLVSVLKTTCTGPNDNVDFAPMDITTPLSFDSDYYVNLLRKNGLFTSDNALLQDDQTLRLVKQFVDFNVFLQSFRASIRKMGAIGVRTGNNGVIRRQCGASR